MSRLPHWKYLVVEDHITDETAEIARSYAAQDTRRPTRPTGGEDFGAAHLGGTVAGEPQRSG